MAVEVNLVTVAGSILADDPTAHLKVHSLVWEGVTTAGHICLVRQVNGDPLWGCTAAAANDYRGITFANSSNDGGVFAKGGVETITLTSGNLYIYLSVQ